MKKKLLALLLACSMVMSVAPAAFAEDAPVAQIGTTTYTTLSDAIAAADDGDVVIELLADATLDYNAREKYGTAETTSLTIDGKDNTLTLNQKDSDWSSIGLANADAKLVLNNMTIEKTGYGDTSGAWNTHAIIIKSDLEMTNVTVNNSVAVEADAKLTDVTINEANGYYALWVNGNGQTVTVNGSAINATNGGRGIKIADEYVGDDVAQVTLNVTDTTFNTAKKAAVLVSSTAGAKVTASGVDISKVAEDTVNFVWVDEDWAAAFGNVIVEGGAVVQEGEDSFKASVGSGNAISGYYKTLQEAVAAAQDGDTIVLLDDTTGAGVVFENGDNVTIDLNGKTYTLSESIGSSAQYGTVGFYLWAGSDVTIKNGTINMVEDQMGDDDTFFKMFHTYGALTLTDVELDCTNGVWWNGTKDNDAGFIAVESDNGTVVLNGNTSITNCSSLSPETWTVTAYKNGQITIDTTGTIDGVVASYGSNAAVEITNGTFTNSNNAYGQLHSVSDGAITVLGGTYDEDPAKWVAEGYQAYSLGDGLWSVNEENATVNVTFESEGKTVETQEVPYAGKAASVRVTREGYDFEGWYLDGEEFDFDTIIVEDITLTAKWDREPVTPVGPTAYKVDIEADGVESSHKTAKKGEIVTLTVEDGLEIIVLDEDGDEIELTYENGEYTFEMPGCDVTVEEVEKVVGNPFLDVADDAYYTEAVLWAVENGITTGTGAVTFSPDASCTRAQVVTFLWRAAGSPEPKSTVMPFADVAADAYYYNAVLWAVEIGITDGTSATTFSPDAACTRAQIVTFLWRSQGSEDASAYNPFVDVANDAYYTEAVLWAVENGITNGTGADTFSPDADCTRGQIVTFLYRCLAK